MRKGRGEEGGGGVHDEKSRERVKERERKKIMFEVQREKGGVQAAERGGHVQ